MGRRNWQDPKTLEKVKRQIDEYFKSCEGEYVYNPDGTPYMFRGEIIKKDYKVPSMAGLALALGFNGKEAINKLIANYHATADNDGKEDIGSILLNAKLRIEEAIVQASMTNVSFKGSNLQLISLFGYTDKAVSQIEVTNKNPNQISKVEAVKALKELGLTPDAKLLPSSDLAKKSQAKRREKEDIEALAKMAEEADVEAAIEGAGDE